jgi:uncharacterized protein (TIGR00730 family)
MNDTNPQRFSRYSTGDPTLDERLAELVGLACTEAERRYVQEIATTALRLGIDCAKRIDLKIANAALKEMRYAFKIFTPYRQAQKVTVFGSARTPPDAPDHERAINFGKLMAEVGWMVVTGAGSGIMGAAHQGAGRNLSFGVNIQLPFEQQANETIHGDKKLMNFRYFFTRKLFLLKEVNAVVLFPGGFGTLDECFEVLTLLQTGKQTPIPVVMIESPKTGYFRALEEFIDQRALGNGLISAQDKALYRIVSDPVSARDEVLGFYRVYHSSRYVGGRLVIRLNRDLAEEELALLNEDFGHILRSGTIERAQPLPEELGTHLHGLARIQLEFNRRDFGHLRRFIDALNAFDSPAG